MRNETDIIGVASQLFMDVFVKNKNIHYVKKGNSNNTLLIVHGWGSDSANFDKLINLFSDHFTTIAIDLPGFGLSDLPDADWGIQEYGLLLSDFLQALNIQKCIYFGHSFGGALGVYMAATYPNLIDKLILCAPSFKRSTTVNPKNSFAIKMYRLLHINKYWPLKRLYYKVFFPKSDLPRFPKLESNFKKIVANDLTPLVSSIKVKTLILWGDRDSYVPVDDAYVLNKGIENSSLIIYEGSEHKFPKTETDRVYQDVIKFLTNA